MDAGRDGSRMDETDRRVGRVAFGRRLLRLPEVMERTGVSKPTIYRLIKAGEFPKPVSLGVRAVGWDAHSIDEWIEAREVSAAYADTAGRGYGRFEQRDRRRSETTTSAPKRQTVAREPGPSERRRGTGTKADREELAELEKKIATLIAALEDVGHARSIMDRVIELEAERDKLLGRIGR